MVVRSISIMRRRPHECGAINRPSIPIISLYLVILWLTLAVSLYAGLYMNVVLSCKVLVFVGLAVVLAALVGVFSRAPYKVRIFAVMLCGATGLALGAHYVQGVLYAICQVRQVAQQNSLYEIHGIVESDVGEFAFGSSCTLKVIHVRPVGQNDSKNGTLTYNDDLNDQTSHISSVLENKLITVRYDKPHSAPDVPSFRESCAYGNVISVTGKLTAYDQGKSFEQRKLIEGVIAQLKVDHIVSVSQSHNSVQDVIYGLRSRALESLDPQRSPERSLIAGLCVGYKETLQEMGIRDTFSQTGLSHMVAVSGTHLALVLMFIERVTRIVHLRRFQRIVVLVVTCTLFVVFTGMQISAVRSLLMTTASLMAPIFKRRAHSLSGLSVAGCLILFIQPQAALNVSFILSVSSVASIIIFNPLIERLISCGYQVYSPVLSSVRSAISMSICAQLATMWLTVALFGMFSTVSPLANACITPIMSALLLSGLVTIIGTLILDTLQISFLSFYELLDIPSHICLKAAQMFAHLPGAWFSVSASVVATVGVTVIVLIMMWSLYHRVRYLSLRVISLSVVVLTAASLAVTVIQTPDGIYALDVGQGDAILVRSKGCVMLVDTGDDDALLKPLARNHVSHVDILVLTHLDRDHVGGIPALARTCSVDYVVVASGVSGNLDDSYLHAFESMGVRQILEVQRGDTLQVGNVNSRVLWPNHQVLGDENQDSVCILTTLDQWGTAGDFTALLTGDLESEELQHVIDESLQQHTVTVLKVGHHGARVSLTEAQALTLNSRWALISCGKKNRYGHPHRDCLNSLISAHSEVLRTDIMGDCGIVSFPWGLSPYRQKDE